MNALLQCLQRTRRSLTIRPADRSRIDPVVGTLLAHHVVVETDRSVAEGVGRLEGPDREETIPIELIVERLNDAWIQGADRPAVESAADAQVAKLLDAPVSLIRHRSPEDLVTLTMEVGRRASHTGDGRVCAALLPEMGAFEAAIGRATDRLVADGLTVTTVVERRDTSVPAGHRYVDTDGAFDDIAFVCFDGGSRAAGAVFLARPDGDDYEVLISFDQRVVDSIVMILDAEFPGLLGPA
ncbi:hypothetical protein HARCEL1_00195 [Halococcoides cellulosivorans]|uniref:Uncharacterized protein n=2 Tax=Halococcoides cellulosivorans TaxID=1679096 RepID=A0A2R4WXK7_9EURY|nr:hypothetical protein HARCEL1_00195 [Halococcoides cellulosivorans]